LTFISYDESSLSKSLPYFLTFDPTHEAGLWYSIEIEDTLLEGSHYDIVLEVGIWDPVELTFEHSHKNVINSRFIYWTIDLTYFPYIPPNEAPRFTSEIKNNFVLDLGDEASFTTGIPTNDTIKLDIQWKPKNL